MESPTSTARTSLGAGVDVLIGDGLRVAEAAMDSRESGGAGRAQAVVSPTIATMASGAPSTTATRWREVKRWRAPLRTGSSTQ